MLIDNIFRSVVRRILLCMCLGMALPVHAIIFESESNDIFADLTDVTNAPDFSQAQIGVNDTYRAAIGILPMQPENIFADDAFQANDLDWWEFDLRIGTTFIARLTEIPTQSAGYSPSVLLYVEREGRLLPVASNGTQATTLRNFINFAPWQNGHYFLGISDSNNVPFNMAGGNQQSGNFHATPLTPTVAPLALFTGNGGGSFVYDLKLEGTYPVASAVPVPAALWLFMSGLLSLGMIRRKAR